MIYGIGGASGTGKSTLAADCAEYLDLAFMQTSITAMSKRAGFDPVAPLTLADRIALQEGLLVQFQELLRGLRGPAILDRTPLDLAMYMMAELTMHSHREVNPQMLEQAYAYVGKCLDLTERYLDHVFVTTPLESYEATNTRPPENPAYQLHCHILMLGLTADLNSEQCSILNITDHSDRVDYVAEVVSGRLDSIEALRRHSAHIH